MIGDSTVMPESRRTAFTCSPATFQVAECATTTALLWGNCDLNTAGTLASGQLSMRQAVIFVFFAAEQFLSKYRQKLVVRSTQEELRQQAAAEAAEGSVK